MTTIRLNDRVSKFSWCCPKPSCGIEFHKFTEMWKHFQTSHPEHNLDDFLDYLQTGIEWNWP